MALVLHGRMALGSWLAFSPQIFEALSELRRVGGPLPSPKRPECVCAEFGEQYAVSLKASSSWKRCNVDSIGALITVIIIIGFGVYYTITIISNSQNSIGNYDGPYITCEAQVITGPGFATAY